MTVLFFARYFYPHIGGVEKHVLEVGERLVEKGYRVIVVSEKSDTTYSSSKQSNASSATYAGEVFGIESYNIQAGNEGFFKKFRVWRQLWSLRKIIRDADIVHCHDIFFWYLPFRFLFLQKPVFTTFHGYEGNYLPTRKAVLMHKLAEKLSRGNICIGKFLEKWYGTKATSISYGAVDDSYKKIDKNADKNLIVFLGRLEEEAGIMEYLRAFKKIAQKYPKLKLIVLGDGSLRKKAEQYSRENGLNVGFKGFVENTASFLHRTNFVFTSRYLGILESLASKNYVLSVYNNLIMKDYLKETPFWDYISISHSSEGIVDEFIRHYEKDKLTMAVIDKGYKWAKEQTWDKMVNMYLDLWSKSSALRQD